LEPPLHRLAISLGGRDFVEGQNGGHCLEHAIASNERVKQRCRDVQQDQRKEREGKIEMRVPKAGYAGCRSAAGSREDANL